MLFPEKMPMPVAIFMYGIPGAGKDFFERILAQEFQRWIQKRMQDGTFQVVKLSELTLKETEDLFSLMGTEVLQLSPNYLFVKGERGLYSGFLVLLDPDKQLHYFTQEGYNGKNPTLYGRRTYHIVRSIQERFTRAHELGLSQFRMNHVYQDAPNSLEVRRQQLLSAGKGSFLLHVLMDTPRSKCEARNQLRDRTIEPDEFELCAQAPIIFEQLKDLPGDLGGMWVRITDITDEPIPTNAKRPEDIPTKKVRISWTDGFSQTFDVVHGENKVPELISV